ncbi:hypothetical protein GCM10007315_26080 [Gemmobacter tilapiae]|uniref:DUF192 domain-containing protein n=2 Tax=Neogemmobacter tilapiae TaxID=875041 RepID=A0A918WKW4_9RHOB|nr:hypothetical protein GCM10007315_26080 [Gemmobacter tilapiae]
MKALALALMVLPAGGALAQCAPDRVDIRGAGGAMAHFTVEVADEVDERAQGLMFRESMAADAGMLFVYPAPQRAMFWMKNTLIPLDMVFVGESGKVLAVHEGAVPHDETPIDGGQGVKLVLEVNAGTARATGITPGAELRHPSIDATLAVWPCAGD